MKRLIYDNLLAWKKRERRKPLLLLGARQVGKTYILKAFGEAEFDNFVYVNCHKEVYAQQLFRDVDAVRIVNELQHYLEVDIVPGKTLLFLDEIQEIRNGLASLKYFCEDLPDLHVAVAGSLLGISLHEGESYPVGKVETMQLYPMTFSEYLLARGRSRLLETLQQLDWETLRAQHELLTGLLREYYFVGGMPEAVQEYVDTQDVRRVRFIQNDIIDAYRRDMSKHTKTQVQRINMVWDSVPSQLARENKKFMFGAVRKGARAADYELALQWLVDAGIVYKVHKTRQPMAPLKFYADESAFKLYLPDVGLLACMMQANPNDMLLGTHAFVEFKGALTENYVLEQLRSQLPADVIFYFSKDNSTQEVDFVVQCEGRVVPVEVKSEENVKSKSLSGFINVDHADKQLKGLRISMKPYVDQGWMENIPLYAAEAYFKTLADGY